MNTAEELYQLLSPEQARELEKVRKALLDNPKALEKDRAEEN